MQEVIQTFHIDWKLMLAQVVNFGLVLTAFYFLAAKPLRKLMHDRTAEIKGGIDNAKENALLLEQTKKEYAKVLTNARAEAQKIFEDSKKEALAKKESMMLDAKMEVESMIASGKKTLEAEKTKMVADAKKEVAGLVISATEKLLGKKIDGSLDQHTLKELNNL